MVNIVFEGHRMVREISSIVLNADALASLTSLTDCRAFGIARVVTESDEYGDWIFFVGKSRQS